MAGADGAPGMDADPAAISMMVKRDVIRTSSVSDIYYQAMRFAGGDAGNINAWHLEAAVRDVLTHLSNMHDGSAASVKAAATYLAGVPAPNVLRSRIRAMLDGAADSLTNAQAAKMVVMDVYALYGPGAVADANIDMVLLSTLVGPSGDPNQAADMALMDLKQDIVHNHIVSKVAGMGATSVADLEADVREVFMAFGATTLPETASVFRDDIRRLLGDAPLDAENIMRVVGQLLDDFGVMTGDKYVQMALAPAAADPTTPDPTTPDPTTPDPTTPDPTTPMTAEEMIDAVVMMTGAAVIESDLSNDAEDYMASGNNLLIDDEDEVGGVSVAMGLARPDFADIEGTADFYGGWLKSNFFGVIYDDTLTGDDMVRVFSVGAPTGSQPTAGTWEGAMTGYLDENDNANNGLVSGVAVIKVTVEPDGDRTAGLSLMNIMRGDSNRGALVPADDATGWNAIDVKSKGQFSLRSEVDGVFYGEGASEVGGTLMRTVISSDVPDNQAAGIDPLSGGDMLTGAFGAAKK
jgi:hypothetical protein